MTRGELLALGREGDGVLFVNLATKAIREWPEDDELRLLLIHHLVKWGLLYRASQYCSEMKMGGGAELADLRSKLSCIRNHGLASWSRFEQQYRNNLHLLEKRVGGAPEVKASWNPRGFELHQTRAGEWQLFDVGAQEWRPAFGDFRPPQTIEAIALGLAGRLIAPLVIDGLGLGATL
ncbi:MAG TPA: hypothetical protein VNT79_04090, partial [Phycisphaerae bacterium]|nr:hypothetical protein [Phycisphaerae bacterium]